MPIGKLKHRVTVQQLTSGQDSIGQPQTSWTTVATVWADVRYLNGLEAVKAGAEVSSAQASVRVRKQSDFTPAMRIVHSGVNLQIKAILPDEQGGVYMDLACERVT